MTSDFDQPGERAGEELGATYSQTVIDHIRNPHNVGALTNADGHAMITGPCGDTMGIWLMVRDGVIHEARFLTDGCGVTVAAGSVVTQLARGRMAAEALNISQQDVVAALGGLPQEHLHCALLAVNTLKSAIREYISLRNEPWKRAYRRR